MVVFPNAKINLGLNVVSKRADGYHNIRTVFYPIPLYDVLEVTDLCSDLPADRDVVLHTIGMVNDGKPNLVEKAYYALAKNYALPPVEVWLKKNIPAQAGLGGGSADAAFMLMALVNKYKLPVSENELYETAKGLGADCPFFLHDKPLSASGIGCDFSPADVSLDGLHILLVKPKVSVSTAEAYAGIRPHEPETDLDEILRKPIEQWRDLLVNDFEVPVFAKYPELEKVKNTLYEAGALYASMSGSGSAIFGLFENKTETKYIMENCRNIIESSFERLIGSGRQANMPVMFFQRG